LNARIIGQSIAGVMLTCSALNGSALPRSIFLALKWDSYNESIKAGEQLLNMSILSSEYSSSSDL